MGSNSSSQKLEEEKRKKAKQEEEFQQKKRDKLEKELREMENAFRITASSHYESAEYYKRIDHKLQYVSLLGGFLGTSGGAFSTLAWGSLVQKYPRRTPVLAALSLVSVLFSAAVHIPEVPNSPGTLYTLHFESGIDCQYLQRRVRFMADTKVWDLSIPWEEIASNYEELLKEKKEVNGRIQAQTWAYYKALEMIREEDELMESQKRNEQEI